VAVPAVWTSAIIDDAYITFRYSYNLAHIHQFVFNSNEWIEGTTNLLWAVLLAPMTLLPIPIEQCALTSAIVCLIWTALPLSQIGKHMRTTPFATVVAVVVLAANRDFVAAATNGLEAALYAALLTELVYRLARENIVGAFTAAGLLFITRPEGAAFGVVLAVVVFLNKGWQRDLGRGLIVWLGILISITLFRFHMFGMVVPNSVVAKSQSIWDLVRHGFGLLYLIKYWLAEPHLIAIVGIAVAVLLKKSHRQHGGLFR
jgi:arabinofuranosyltransferase